MTWLGPAVAAAFIANVVLLFVYGYLLSVDRSKHLRLWTAAWLASSVRYAGSIATVAVGGSRILSEAEHLFALATAWFLLLGTYAFVQRRLSPVWHALFAAAAVWQVATYWAPQTFLAETLPTFTLLGGASIAIAVAFWRTSVAGGERTAARVVAVVFFIWGLHRLDYPWLRPMVGIAPYGFALAATLELLAAAGAAVAHFERLRSQLSASEQRFRALVENSPQGIFSTTLDGRIVEANRALAEMLGYESVAELRELNMAEDVYADPEERARLTAEARGADVIAGTEVVWRKRSGDHVRVAIYGRQIRDSDGNVSAYQGVVVDDTERRRLEQRVRQMDRLNALGRLAGGVAHDFNNLLTVIQGGVELAARPKLSDDERSLALKHVREAAERAASLTRELLSMSRGQALEPRVLDLGEAVVKSVGVLGRLVGEDVEIVTEVDQGPFLVFADPSKIDQVLLNLAANARDAMPRGGRLTLTVDGSVLGSDAAKARGVEPRAYVRLRVKDEGAGMDEETRSRAFEPFFTTKGSGTGLGLATVYGIVLQSGGHIELRSEPGAGTTFEILFPREDVSERPRNEPPRSRPHSAAPCRILVVEDEPLVRNMVVRILRGEGYEAVTADNGEQALAIARESLPDVLLTDVVMPQMGGRELALTLRKDHPDLPVLFMSGYPEELGERERLPDVRFLAKPFTAAALLAAIAAAADCAAGRRRPRTA